MNTHATYTMTVTDNSGTGVTYQAWATRRARPYPVSKFLMACDYLWVQEAKNASLSFLSLSVQIYNIYIYNVYYLFFASSWLSGKQDG